LLCMSHATHTISSPSPIRLEKISSNVSYMVVSTND
jgi:hypothetical protein